MLMAKKKGAVKVEEHRRVTLMSSAYKVYATVLANRFVKEIEEKGIIPEWQAEFRKSKEVMENMYMLNYLMRSELESKRVVAALVDFRRRSTQWTERYWEGDWKKRGKQTLRERIMKIYEETRCMVRVKYRKRFWTTKKIRQRSAEPNAV